MSCFYKNLLLPYHCYFVKVRKVLTLNNSYWIYLLSQTAFYTTTTSPFYFFIFTFFVGVDIAKVMSAYCTTFGTYRNNNNYPLLHHTMTTSVFFKYKSTYNCILPALSRTCVTSLLKSKHAFDIGSQFNHPRFLFSISFSSTLVGCRT